MIVATAGHVDHGKTSLVFSLTGVDTDRLEEEKRRGLSITPGYAYWRPDGGTTVGFIDVPGHRRFINNMIAGISGIDLGLLVVAADDGVMPQTREHLDVMNLLGVRHFLLVVTKCDRAEAGRVDAVRAAAAALLPAGTPVHAVSNTTGDGIDALRDAIAQLARGWRKQRAGGHFRLSVDRAFHLQGRGLVLTGTIASGRVSADDTVLLQPQGKPLRVRSIHAQDAPAAEGRAGERCAINVAGDVHRDDIERGDWLTGKAAVEPTRRIDTLIRLLPDAAFSLKHLSRVKLHIGAKQVEARLVLLGGAAPGRAGIRPGESAYAQLVTERPVLCCRGDRFLLRDYGETATLGGGVVLDPAGAKKHRSSRGRLAFLAAMTHDDIEEALRTALEDEDVVIHYERLLKSWNLDTGKRPGRLLRGVRRVDTSEGQLWIAASRWADLRQAILAALADYHRDRPDRPGVEQGRLAAAVPATADRRLLAAAVAELVASGEIRLANGLLAAAAFRAETSGRDDARWRAVAGCLAKAGRQIPNVAQLGEQCEMAAPDVAALLELGRRDGRLVRINADRYADRATVYDFAGAVLALTADGQPLTVAACRDYLGCGRNVLIEVLEYFDSIGFTRRAGNARIVLDRNLPAGRFAAAAKPKMTTGKSDVPGGAPGLQNQ